MSLAETIPNKSLFDSRVRIIDYNRLDVVKLSTFYGVSTHVEFGAGETIKDVAIGDDQAWNIVPRGNHLFIKPKARKADTNVTVVTDKHVYNFALVVQHRSSNDVTAWKDPNLVYGVSFRYPEEEAAKLAEEKAAKEKADEIKRRWDTVKSKFSKITKEGAIDYVGTKEIPLFSLLDNALNIRRNSTCLIVRTAVRVKRVVANTDNCIAFTQFQTWDNSMNDDGITLNICVDQCFFPGRIY